MNKIKYKVMQPRITTGLTLSHTNTYAMLGTNIFCLHSHWNWSVLGDTQSAQHPSGRTCKKHYDTLHLSKIAEFYMITLFWLTNIALITLLLI